MQLNELEEHELLSKVIYAQLPPKVEYSLTDLGVSLMPIINALGEWGDENQEQLRKAVSQRL